jgi:hypothetical protein
MMELSFVARLKRDLRLERRNRAKLHLEVRTQAVYVPSLLAQFFKQKSSLASQQVCRLARH